LTLAADVIAPENLVGRDHGRFARLGTPDIDLKDSRPSRALFAGLAVFFSFALLFHFAPKLSIAEMWIMWLATLLSSATGCTRHSTRQRPSRRLAHVDRGHRLRVRHGHHLLLRVRSPGRRRWLAGGFLLIGFLTHLILDEMYSVDVLGNHIKRSFGTAFKPIDLRNPWGSALMAAAAVALLFMTPSITTFYDGITSGRCGRR
jgi:hypothetical protein